MNPLILHLLLNPDAADLLTSVAVKTGLWGAEAVHGGAGGGCRQQLRALLSPAGLSQNPVPCATLKPWRPPHHPPPASGRQQHLCPGPCGAWPYGPGAAAATVAQTQKQPDTVSKCVSATREVLSKTSAPTWTRREQHYTTSKQQPQGHTNIAPVPSCWLLAYLTFPLHSPSILPASLPLLPHLQEDVLHDVPVVQPSTSSIQLCSITLHVAHLQAGST